LLGLLVLIAGVIVAYQYRYDPAQWREAAQTADGLQSPVPASDSIDGLTSLSIMEHYDAANLSDKINGKAELYLAAGFKQLESRRFALLSDPGRWMERYVYHMEGHRSAYAVFSAQQRPDVESLELGQYAYLAANGLFMVHGPFYVEIIAAEVSDEMRAKAIELAQSFVAGHTVVAPPLVELALFPEQGQVPNSRMLVAAGAFGLEGLNGVFTCRYAEAGREATAFISKRSSATEAGDLAQAFIGYWRDYGGEAVALPSTWMGLKAVTILDNYELVWVHGDYLLGVHEATDLEFGLELAGRLRQALRE
jgi:hypothetical protein